MDATKNSFLRCFTRLLLLHLQLLLVFPHCGPFWPLFCLYKKNALFRSGQVNAAFTSSRNTSVPILLTTIRHRTTIIFDI